MFRLQSSTKTLFLYLLYFVVHPLCIITHISCIENYKRITFSCRVQIFIPYWTVLTNICLLNKSAELSLTHFNKANYSVLKFHLFHFNKSKDTSKKSNIELCWIFMYNENCWKSTLLVDNLKKIFKYYK